MTSKLEAVTHTFTGDTHNLRILAPGQTERIFIDAGGIPRDWTGIVKPPGPFTGTRLLFVENIGGETISILANDANSDVGNRFSFAASIGAGSLFVLLYEPYDGLWHFVTGTATVTGVTDHGGLTGLSDDDHSQYLLLAGRGGQAVTDTVDFDELLEGGVNVVTDDLTLTTTSPLRIDGGASADLSANRTFSLDEPTLNASLDHGLLSGLGDDDHTQYLPRSGVRPMTGTLDTDGNDVTMGGGTLDTEGGDVMTGGGTLNLEVGNISNLDQAFVKGTSGAGTGIYFQDTTVGSNQRLWLISGGGSPDVSGVDEDFYIWAVNDARTASTAAFRIERGSGIGITSIHMPDLELQGDITFNTGGNLVNATTLELATASPAVTWDESGQSANEAIARFWSDASDFVLSFITDDELTFNDVIRVSRSGATPSQIQLGATLNTGGGDVEHSGGASLGAAYYEDSGTPATSGVLRCSNATTGIAFRNAANSANIAALVVGSGNVLTVGDATNAVAVAVKASGNIALRPDSAGSDEWTFDGDKLDGQGNYFTDVDHWISTAGPGIFFGSGSPEGAQTAAVGSIYGRTDGGSNTSVYIKESGSGNTGWVAIF